MNATNDELLKMIDKMVVVKLNNGRVISGILRAANDGYTIKLGVKHLSLDLTTLKSVTLHDVQPVANRVLFL